MKMKRELFKYLAWMIAVACFACAGNPATAPAPLAEVPAELRIPKSVAINVDEIRSATGGTSSIKNLVGSGGTFSDQIAFGADQVTQENQFVDEILGPLNTFTIPASPSTTTFQTTVDVGGLLLGLKMDFANFDFDGDGVSEGCSGHTAALPICMRIYVSNPTLAGGAYQRRLEAVFTSFPTDNNPGAGRLRGTQLQSKDDQGAESGLFQVIYDRTDSTNLSNELFFGAGRSESNPNDFVIKAHALTTQMGPVDHAIKTLLLSGSTDFGGGTSSVGQYIGKFRVDADFWGGTVDIENPSGTEAFQDKCAQISSGNEVPIGDCQNLNIDVGQTGFIDFLNPADVMFPADFPNSPPF